MLQCVAVCCSVLQCVVGMWNEISATWELHYEGENVVCCSVVQCGAVSCSVLQSVAVCCRVLQCVAVC